MNQGAWSRKLRKVGAKLKNNKVGKIGSCSGNALPGLCGHSAPLTPYLKVAPHMGGTALSSQRKGLQFLEGFGWRLYGVLAHSVGYDDNDRICCWSAGGHYCGL